MGVSRSVVREALGRLASLGLVRSLHGSGTRVEAPSGKLVATGYQILLKRGEVRLSDVAAVRLPLETAIAAEAARRRNDDHLARLAEAQAALANPRGGLEAHVKSDLAFHAVLAEATGNPLFGMVLAPIQELLIETRRRTLGRHGAALAHDHHALILDAVRAGDPAAAERAMRRISKPTFNTFPRIRGRPTRRCRINGFRGCQCPAATIHFIHLPRPTAAALFIALANSVT